MEKTANVTRFKERRANTNSASGVVCVALCAACIAVSVVTFCVLCAGI